MTKVKRRKPLMRVVSMLLALVLVLSTGAFSVFAEDDGGVLRLSAPRRNFTQAEM